MAKNTFKQYTIRNIPERVDSSLRRKAKLSGKSFNQIVVEALTMGSGEQIKPKRDFSFIIGSMSEKEASEMENEIRNQRKIDRDLWK
jgi:hypothetical protein